MALSSRQLSGLKKYSDDVVSFIEGEITLPDGRPIVLEPHQKALLWHCFTLREDGRLPYTEIVWLLPKKSGKTSISAGVVLWVACCWAGAGPRRVVVAANSHDQAVEQVFADCAGAIERNPRLSAVCKVQSTSITVADGSTITAVPCNPRAISGGRPTMVSQDEVWQAGDDARLTQLYEELSPDPSQPNSFRLITSHAGYTQSLLSRLFDRGMGGEDVAIFDGPTPAGLVTRARGRFFLAHDTGLRMPWQTQEWVEDQQGRLTPETFARQVLNQFAEKQERALTAADIDAAFSAHVQPYGYDEQLEEGTVVAAGLDVGITHDATACCVVALSPDGNYRLLKHAIWTPAFGREIWLEDVADFLEECAREVGLHVLAYDPDQAIGIAQAASELGIAPVRITQDVTNQTAMVNALLDAFGKHRIALYTQADVDLGEHLRNVEIEKIEGGGGQRFKKPSRHKLIDGAVALSLALVGCGAAVGMDLQPTADFSFGSADGGPLYTTKSDRRRRQSPLHPQTLQRLQAAYPTIEDWPGASDWRPLQVPASPSFITCEEDRRTADDALAERRQREVRMTLLWERHRPKRPGESQCSNPEYWRLHDACWLHGGLGDTSGCPICNDKE